MVCSILNWLQVVIPTIIFLNLDNDVSYISSLSSSPFPYSSYGYQIPKSDEYANEPSLLDELEIYPMRIIETALAIVNPFHVDMENQDHLLFVHPDLAGPVLFGFVLGAALSLSGGETRFGSIYGLSAFSIFAMFFIAQLLGESQSKSRPKQDESGNKLLSISDVISVLGYALLPIVWLAIVGVFVTLKSMVGAILGVSALAMATRAASGQFARLIGNPDYRLLLAIPCGLVYLVFMFIVIF